MSYTKSVNTKSINLNKSDYRKLITAQKKIKPHLCLFHQDNPITKYCKKQQCNLPLCQFCKNIHLNQHQKLDTEAIIQDYQKILHQSIQQIISFQKSASEHKKHFLKQFEYEKERLKKIIQLFFHSLKGQILQIFDNTEKFKQLNQIKQNLLKSQPKILINYLSNIKKTLRVPKFQNTYQKNSLDKLLLNSFCIIYPNQQNLKKSEVQIKQSIKKDFWLSDYNFTTPEKQNLHSPIDQLNIKDLQTKFSEKKQFQPKFERQKFTSLKSSEQKNSFQFYKKAVAITMSRSIQKQKKLLMILNSSNTKNYEKYLDKKLSSNRKESEFINQLTSRVLNEQEVNELARSKSNYNSILRSQKNLKNIKRNKIISLVGSVSTNKKNNLVNQNENKDIFKTVISEQAQIYQSTKNLNLKDMI